MKSEKQNLIVELSFEFSLAVIRYCETLENRKKDSLAKPLFSSATQLSLNVRESQCAETKAIALERLLDAAQKARETEYWLLLCKKLPDYPGSDQLLETVKTINTVLLKVIAASKKTFSNYQIN